MGPTLVAYLRGAGAGVVGFVEATTATAVAGMAGALWLAATTVVGVAAAAVVSRGVAVAAVGSGPGLDPPIRGGEERRTRGLKLCPPRVLTMPGSEKGRRWREWEEEEEFFF